MPILVRIGALIPLRPSSAPNNLMEPIRQPEVDSGAKLALAGRAADLKVDSKPSAGQEPASRTCRRRARTRAGSTRISGSISPVPPRSS